MDAATDQDSLASRCPAAHQGGLGRGRGAVVVGRGNDVQSGQLRHQRLVFVDRLERALADLRLVGRVGGVELAAQEQLVDDGWGEVPVCAGAEEAGQVDAVAGRKAPQSSRQIGFGFGRWQPQTGGSQGLRDVGEQVVD
jgi:hypothetical protein